MPFGDKDPDKPEPTRFPANYEAATWIWDSPQTLDSNELFSLMDQTGLNTIYLNVNSWVDIQEEKDLNKKSNDLASFENRLKEILATAHQKNYKVHALAGDKDWADSDHAYLPKMMLDYVIAYNDKNP
ncbi:MAG TPA: hypothetical protein VEC17_03370, partial [Candidatus Binatia bacterium]|nr:hypothetical protein [Candidatus Binatia bacterium]